MTRRWGTWSASAAPAASVLGLVCAIENTDYVMGTYADMGSTILSSTHTEIQLSLRRHEPIGISHASTGWQRRASCGVMKETSCARRPIVHDTGSTHAL